MSINSEVTDKILGLVGGTSASLGSSMTRSLLHSLYPSEFELYMVSLELTDSEDRVEEYFTFPINPSMISKTEPTTKTIERTFGGVIVNKSGSFTPQDLNIKGNFGRDFQILVRSKIISFNSILKQTTSFGVNFEEFSPTIKTGYGSLKILQGICKRSNQVIDGKPMKLYFHNFMLGESYLVEVIDFTPDMNMSTNMIWNYSLKMKILTPINIGVTKRLSLGLVGTVQKTISSVTKGVKDLVNG